MSKFSTQRTASQNLNAGQFGAGVPVGINPALYNLHNMVFEKALNNRTKVMLFEDLVGFGVIRTGMDLLRQFFFERKPGETPELNVPAARERLIREVGSIITDNVSAGIIGWAAGAWVDKKMNGFSNQFLSNETLTLFEKLAKTSSNPQTFVTALANTLAPAGKQKSVEQLLKGTLDAASNRKIRDKVIGDAAVTLAKMHGQDHLDRIINKEKFAMNGLIDDAKIFLSTLNKQVKPSGNWQTRALSLLKKTNGLNRWRLPLGVMVAMGLTYSIPYLNKYVTRRMDGLESYPGELGLRQAMKIDETKKQGWFDRLFPYLGQAQKEGKIMPFILSLIPLPFALGLVDSVKLSTGNFKLNQVFNLPFKGGKWNPDFMKRLASMFQFGKGFPFTTQQQIASLFAFLIFSRMTTARSDIEFRERTVDSFLGWGLWILATPMIQRLFAQNTDKRLLKKVGDETLLKSKFEVQRLINNPLLRNQSMGRLMGIKLVSLAATVLLMGVIEPYIAIKWTEWKAKKQAA